MYYLIQPIITTNQLIGASMHFVISVIIVYLIIAVLILIALIN